MNSYYNKNNSRIKSIIEALFYNRYFYIAYNILFLVLAKITNSYYKVFFTAYFLIFTSYFIHIWSHKIPIVKNLHLLHHTKKINKYISAEILELFLNLLFIGGGILIPLNLYFKSDFSPFNEYAILLYTLIYTFQHMVVYHLLKVPSHTTHHTVDKTCLDDTCKTTEKVYNYGPDAIDVLFGTKKHLQEYENMGPLIPFIIILIILVIFNYNNKFDVIKWLQSKIY